MVALEHLTLVFVAGLLTALATGLGALPFFLVEEFSDRWNVALWGLASGIMLAASTFGLVQEGLTYGDPILVVPGLVAGAVLVIVANRVIDAFDGVDPDAATLEQAGFAKLVLILGVLTVHSFPEGVAVGVSFAELGIAETADTIGVFGLALPTLAVFMTLAISIHNVPEGVAISIPLRSLDVGEWKMVWWAVFSSLPQPVGAVVAYAFVTQAKAFLPAGFGFAAGAMIYLVFTEFVPEALDLGATLPGNGWRELLSGGAVGVLLMVPLAIL